MRILRTQERAGVILPSVSLKAIVVGAATLLCSFCAQAQSADRPVWRIGDAWTYRSMVLPSYEAPTTTTTTQYEIRVGSVNATHCLLERTQASAGAATNQRWSLDINRLSRIRSTDQWQEFRRYQWPLAQGKTWDAPYEGADVNTSWSVRVQGWEDVTVPAGTFRAIRIDLKRTDSGGRRTVKQEALWYAPAVKRHVRLEEHEYVAGYHMKHTMEELVRFVAAE